MEKTRIVSNFKNFCYRCFHRIDIPLLSDFSYGEVLFQTDDGQDFYIAELTKNPTFDFITSILIHQKLKVKQADPQKILALLADKPNGKSFTINYPICPICKRKKRGFNDNVKTTEREVGFASWTYFESLTQPNKTLQLEKAIACLIT